MKHLSRPTILGFGHPSGALEDGARGEFFLVYPYKILGKVRSISVAINFVEKGAKSGQS